MADMYALLRRLWPFAAPRAAARPAATAPVVPAAAPPDIPRYPPFLQGLPVVPSADLLATQEALVQRLYHGLGCTPACFVTTVLPVVDRYAAFVHLLPASEAHHHRGAGGLLHHGVPSQVPAASATPDDARTVAEAWFRSRRPGAGARLLLALAEAIGAGARVPEAVLHIAGALVWVRVPTGLERFGAPAEAQIEALWEDDLLAVDFLKPFLRVRESDGIRGVVLKAEPSGHFQALLPAAALERCIQGTRAPTGRIPTEPAPTTPTPAATPPRLESAGARAPDPRTPPVRRPRPTPKAPTLPQVSTPTTARPSPKPSAGAVADALLAQVRAAAARPAEAAAEEGTGVLVLTPAAIAAAAQAAGLKPQSVRRALMRRPGCTVTAQAGVTVTPP